MALQSQLDADLDLPLKTIAAVDHIENRVRDVTFEKLTRYLGRVGGSDVETVTREIMKTLLTYETAEAYSLFGQRGKKSFSRLGLMVIIDAVRLNKDMNETSDASIKKIGDFLRQAKARLQEQAKQKSPTENETLPQSNDSSQSTNPSRLDGQTAQQSYPQPVGPPTVSVAVHSRVSCLQATSNA